MKKYLSQIFTIAALLALLDQVTKWMVVKYFSAPYEILGNLLKIEYTQNAGIAFGIPVPSYVLALLTPLLIGLILYFAIHDLNLRHRLSRISVALVIGGALGNFIDRLVNGYVIDFIAVLKWPNFNLADSFITTGVLLLILFYAKIRRLKKSNARR